MIRIVTLLAAIFFWSCTAPVSGPPAPPTIDYLVTPQIGDDGLASIAVTLRLRGDSDGRTDLELPDRWAGSDRLYDAIGDLRVEGGSIAPAEDPATRTIVHAPGAPLVVRYRIGGVAGADPGPDYEKARPLLRPRWFFIHGEGAFIGVTGRNEAPANFRWGSAPPGWMVASDLDAFASGMLSVADISHGILVGGTDLRVAERILGGEPVRIVMRGEWRFGDEAFADALARVITAENAYFEAPAVPYFVPLIPLTGGETGAISTGGTGRTGGFSLSSTTNVALDEFLRLLAHEYGHRWFGGSLGPVSDPDAIEYWFTEGFGDFIAAQSLVRAELWSERDYADHLNQLLLRYASSPARTLANADIAARFWENGDIMQAPYDRGHLFALSLDGPTLSQNGLRRALLRMATAPESFPAQATQAERFALAFAPISETPLAPLIATAMMSGAPIALDANLFAPCGAIVWAEQPVYASGYSVEERSDGRYFATINEASPAWEAGLRPGMRYIHRESFRYGDATVPIVMHIGDGSGERELRWLPEGHERVRFQRLMLDETPDGTARAACRARLAGAPASP